MRDFRSHAVQFEDFQAFTAREGLAGRHAQIEPPEIETIESCSDVVDGTLERWRQQRGGVVKARAAAVAAAVAERDGPP
ncbi:MAG: hypothetical protein ACREMQ_07570, partial [Longimicrobiales bacterium]